VGLEVDQVRQLKQLQEENTRLKQLVADLTLDKAMLQDVLAKNASAPAARAGGRIPARQLPGERAACMQGCPDESSYVPLSPSPGSSDGVTYAHS
jgi:hypothetical protein